MGAPAADVATVSPGHHEDIGDHILRMSSADTSRRVGKHLVAVVGPELLEPFAIRLLGQDILLPGMWPAPGCPQHVDFTQPGFEDRVGWAIRRVNRVGLVW